MATEIISRAAAQASGHKKYFTGKECKHGHIAERTTANGICTVCMRDIEARHRDTHREKFREKWRNNEKTRDPDDRRARRKKWELANPDKVKERKKVWERANPERKRQHEKKYRHANPDKIAKKNKAYKKLHAERLSPIAVARTKQWCLANPVRAAELRRKARQDRRARQKEIGGSYTIAEINLLLEKQSWKCINCNTSLRKKRELDHYVPVKLKGPNEIANFQWLCPPCNRKKGAKDPIVWAQENGRLL